MRIEVDTTLETALNRIKAAKWLGGKGHTDTIRFLVDYYETHGALTTVIRQLERDIPGLIEQGMLSGFRSVVHKLLGGDFNDARSLSSRR